MIFVGLDDTDVPDSKGTNQLARAIVREIEGRWRCVRIVRHQLLDDPRVPYTSKNGSASMLLEPIGWPDAGELIQICRRTMRGWYVVGSDPGLCVAEAVPESVVEFGRKCQTAFVSQAEARDLASREAIHLEGLGGTEDGVIGALAAVGLAATEDDGRIVQLGEWPDDLCGVQPAHVVEGRGVELCHAERAERIGRGQIDVGKRLRPNLRAGRAVLFVRKPLEDSALVDYEAIRLP